jgi:hypothetical protein
MDVLALNLKIKDEKTQGGRHRKRERGFPHPPEM